MRTGGFRLLAAAALVAAALVPARAADGLARAKEAAALGSEARAFDLAMEGLKAAPADRDLFLYAVELLPESSLVRAKALSAEAAARLAKDTNDYAAYLAVCKTQRVMSKAPEALSNCKKALELEPTAYPVYRELGLTYAAAGNPRKATETLSQGVEISSGSFQAHYQLARLLEKRGDHARAAASYQRALALVKKDPSAEGGYFRSLAKAGLKRAAAAKPAAPKPAPKQPKAAAKAAPLSTADRIGAAACLGKVREEYLKDNLGTALQQSDACLKLSPSDPDLAAERAPLLVRLGRYEDGVKEYERAAGLLSGDKAAAGLMRVKAGETWLKLSRPAEAAAQFRLALASSPKDMNALKGLAAALEARSDPAGASEVYAEILKLEPGNARARSRREELRAAALTDEQILEELRERGALDAGKKGLLPEDKKYFKALKAAELGGAADYLKLKLPAARGLTLKKEGPDGVRLLLTGAGYKAYVASASKDAVKFFETEKVGLREIFQLRDQAGAPVFDKAGRLTPEGEELWRKSAPGSKTWLMPYDPVPESAQAKAAKEAQDKIAGFTARGYQEISEPEYLWLLRATDCPEDVMKKDPISLQTFHDGERQRYLLCYVMNSLCMNPINDKLPSYIERYRSGDDSVSTTKTSTAFFGTGGTKKHRFCEDGKIWGANVNVPDPMKVGDTPR